MTVRPTNPIVIDRGRRDTVTTSVDVLIAARNRADTIERAVLSALAQEEVRTVIVVDDDSSDDTAIRASRLDPESKRVIVRSLRSNVGPSAARNVAIGISNAPWLAILDADDYYLPGRIGVLLAEAGDWDFVADDILQVHAGQAIDKVSAPSFFDHHLEPFALSLERFVLGNVKRRGILRKELGFLKPLVRRSFLERHELRYDESLRLGEDYALYARALAAGARFLIVPVAGYVSVVRADSLSAQHSREHLECLRESDSDLMASPKLTRGQYRALKKHYLSIDCRVQWLVVIEAVKSGKSKPIAQAFTRSTTVSLFIMARLIEELRQRTFKPFLKFKQK
jgi:succinoglycan biosynthesis protein ExoU